MRKSSLWVVMVMSSQLACCCFDFEDGDGGGGGGGDGFGDPSGRTAVPAPLAGEWRSMIYFRPGTTLLIYDVTKGTFLAPLESNQRAGSGYFFYADGRYIYSNYSTVSYLGSCTRYYWSYQQGSVSVSGSTLTLRPTLYRLKVDDGCDDSGDTEVDGPLAAVTYTWGVQTESDNTTYLYLQQSGSEPIKYLHYVE